MLENFSQPVIEYVTPYTYTQQRTSRQPTKQNTQEKKNSTLSPLMWRIENSDSTVV